MRGSVGEMEFRHLAVYPVPALYLLTNIADAGEHAVAGWHSVYLWRLKRKVMKKLHEIEVRQTYVVKMYQNFIEQNTTQTLMYIVWVTKNNLL